MGFFSRLDVPRPVCRPASLQKISDVCGLYQAIMRPDCVAMLRALFLGDPQSDHIDAIAGGILAAHGLIAIGDGPNATVWLTPKGRDFYLPLHSRIG